MKQSFKEPWNIVFKERIGKLRETSNRKRVAYIYDKPDSGTFRYRAYNPSQALNFSNHWTGSYFFKEEIPLLEAHFDILDVMVFIRLTWTPYYDTFFHQARKKNIKLVFDIDDLVFDINKIPCLMNTLSVQFSDENLLNWFGHSSLLNTLGKKCDYSFGTNAYLCKFLQDALKTPSFVTNNFLNLEQIRVSEKLYQNKMQNSNKSDFFKIGYFSGSSTHKNDFDRIAREIELLLEEHPNMKLEVVGFMDFPRYLQKYIQNKQILLSPFVDFLTLQNKIAQVDVNIVPLIDNEFTNCKSELKFFEAAIVGTLTCATPTYVFKENIKHQQTGFLCQEGDWYDYIKKIYNGSISASITKNARDYCLNKYSPESQCPELEKTLETIIQ
ncbi:MAG: hypothetical protein BGO14_08630 [Chlamydiales bacterium 38-26]|nr:glycosyltransferase [Chlamydiales bacterium]OJV11053.1 MAG: hypothetical protein BGO14_08630 [Chlamydiales bacterium 38-26]